MTINHAFRLGTVTDIGDLNVNAFINWIVGKFHHIWATLVITQKQQFQQCIFSARMFSQGKQLHEGLKVQQQLLLSLMTFSNKISSNPKGVSDLLWGFRVNRQRGGWILLTELGVCLDNIESRYEYALLLSDKMRPCCFLIKCVI